LSDYEFSWGITMADLNLDGLQDILISQNYVDLPFQKLFKLPGRMLLQKPDHTFAAVENAAGVVNRNYEIAPLLADFNGDGYLDQIRVNLAGRSRAFLSKGGRNKFLKVQLPINAKWLGAKVSLVLKNGTTLVDWHVSGEGLCSDQEHVIVFGLGESRIPNKIIVNAPGGLKIEQAIHEANTLVKVGFDD
ncbi:MAG: VCBS repeat-containing protein, partial [Planctomycetota bacterium]|nr:VCBS repeat-containing protein [Planctomycetota bacterium]